MFWMGTGATDKQEQTSLEEESWGCRAWVPAGVPASVMTFMPSIGTHEERRVSSWWVAACARCISRMLPCKAAPVLGC